MKRVLVVGMAGLDWRGTAARMAAGGLPGLDALRRRGAMGPLRAAPPQTGPGPWASLATGFPPETHGVFRTEEPWAGGLRPISRAAWRAVPIWERLEAAGFPTGSVAWPASRPGADAAGLHVDDEFVRASGTDWAGWAMPRRCAPSAWRDQLAELRVHPTDISAEMLAPLAPSLGDIDQSRDAALPRLAVAMAEAATIQAAATWMLVEQPVRAVFVHQGWLGAVRAGFEGAAHGPLAKVVDGAWGFLDGLIAGLAAQMGPEDLLLAVSPGWRSGAGVIIAAGPDVRAGSSLDDADLADLAPTLLGLFGLEDPALPGKALAAIAPDALRQPAPRITASPPVLADEALLAEAAGHGYRPPPPAPPAWHAAGLATLAQILLPRDAAAAAATAEAALAISADDLSALRTLAAARVALGESEPLEALGTELERLAPGKGWGALARGTRHALRGEKGEAASWLIKAEAEAAADLETLLHVAATWLSMNRAHDAERVLKAILVQDPNQVAAEIGLSMTAVARSDFIGAEAPLRRALALDPGRAAIHLQFVTLYARTGRKLDLERATATARRLGASEAHISMARGA